ncbi:DUF4112 domain-containing protein, partial [Methylobacterium radiotolerans]|uniref:DUF4112 domain-containing protein n=1 Tax=Methylobacterium radiotolerans TaxID=31998 RepID=UPI000B922FAB
LIGLVPVICDLAGLVISSFIVYEAYRLVAPRWILARLVRNIAFYVHVCAVPVASDLCDAHISFLPPRARLFTPLL